MDRIYVGGFTLGPADLAYLAECVGGAYDLPTVCPDCLQTPALGGPAHVLTESGRVAIGCEGVYPPLVVEGHAECVARGVCSGDH